jgi:hypothetical protein
MQKHILNIIQINCCGITKLISEPCSSGVSWRMRWSSLLGWLSFRFNSRSHRYLCEGMRRAKVWIRCRGTNSELSSPLKLWRRCRLRNSELNRWELWRRWKSLSRWKLLSKKLLSRWKLLCMCKLLRSRLK